MPDRANASKRSLTRLRLVGRLAGISYLVLLGFAMALKHIWGPHTALTIIGMAALPASAQVATAPEAEVLKVVNAFHGEMKKGNAAAVAQLLAPDVLLLEAGGIETRAQYETDHLPADIEFEKVVTATFVPYRVTVVGNAARAVNSSEYKVCFGNVPSTRWASS